MLIFWRIIKTNVHYRDLIRLNLGRNRLDTIPYAALRNLNHLQILEMSDNQISTAAMTPNGFKGNYLQSFPPQGYTIIIYQSDNVKVISKFLFS